MEALASKQASISYQLYYSYYLSWFDEKTAAAAVDGIAASIGFAQESSGKLVVSFAFLLLFRRSLACCHVGSVDANQVKLHT